MDKETIKSYLEFTKKLMLEGKFILAFNELVFVIENVDDSQEIIKVNPSSDTVSDKVMKKALESSSANDTKTLDTIHKENAPNQSQETKPLKGKITAVLGSSPDTNNLKPQENAPNITKDSFRHDDIKKEIEKDYGTSEGISDFRRRIKEAKGDVK